MTDPRRRWFSFSLRTLFVVVTVSAVASPWAVPFIAAKYRKWTEPPDKPIRLLSPEELPEVFIGRGGAKGPDNSPAAKDHWSE